MGGFTLFVRGGAPAWPKEYTEDCQDFAWKVNHYNSCEDGNAINTDGCTSAC